MMRYFAIYLTVMFAALMSLVASTLALVAMTVVCSGIGLFICRRLPGKSREHILLFAIALLLRSSVAYGTWLVDTNTDHPQQSIFCGDGIRYFEDSFLPLGDVLKTFNDPGWISFNHLLTWLGQQIDQPHFLASLQFVLVCSALVPPLLSALLTTLGLRSLAWPAGLVVCLHPMMIAYSTTLIRDQVVACLGLTTCLLVGSTGSKEARWRVVRILAATGLTFVLWELRSASGLFFAAAAALLFYGVRQQQALHRQSTLRLATHAVVLAILFTGSYYAIENELLPHAARRDLRSVNLADEAAEDSLGGQFIRTGGVVNWSATAGQAALAPLPWFNFTMVPVSTFPDTLVGVGGALNQLLFAFVVIGIIRAISRRDMLMQAFGIIALIYVVMATAAYTDPPRYLSTHVLFFFIVLALYGIRLTANPFATYMTWYAAIVAPIYLAYVVLKSTQLALIWSLITIPVAALTYVFVPFLSRALVVTRLDRWTNVRIDGVLEAYDSTPANFVRPTARL